MTRIDLPWPRPPATNNQRGNWQADAARRATTRQAARWTIRAAHLTPVAGRVNIGIHWRIPDRKLRDPDNLGLTLKGCLDALVDEGVLVSDDWRHVATTSQTIHPPEPGRTAAMWLTIEEVNHDNGRP